MEMLFSLEEGKFWRRTVEDICRRANVLKAQNCMLKTGNNGKLHALFTTLEKGGSWGKGYRIDGRSSNLTEGSTRCRFQQDMNNIMKEL